MDAMRQSAPILVLVLFAFLVWPASAHDAPSGWKYPGDCCSNQDCAPVTCDSITETETGFIQGGLVYKRDQVRASGDGACHACATKTIPGTMMRLPRCLFILPSS